MGTGNFLFFFWRNNYTTRRVILERTHVLLSKLTFSIMESIYFASELAGWQSANWYHVMNKTKHMYLNIILNTGLKINKLQHLL